MNITSKLKLSDDISFHMEDDGKGYLTNIENGDVFEINDSTKIIAEKMNGQDTIETIYLKLRKDHINTEFDITEDDMMEVCSFFVENGICYEI